MKRAFTIIELVFVLVILGILASIAITKLAATRQDAEVSKTVANINRLISDFRAYYLSQGQLVSMNQMTNVQLLNRGFGDIDSIPVANKKCIKVTIAKERNDGKPFFVKFEPEENVDSLCQKVLDNNIVKAILINEFSYIKKSTGVMKKSSSGEFEINGLDSQI